MMQRGFGFEGEGHSVNTLPLQDTQIVMENAEEEFLTRGQVGVFSVTKYAFQISVFFFSVTVHNKLIFSFSLQKSREAVGCYAKEKYQYNSCQVFYKNAN